jgi:predicted PurR-regulated permease PerM
MSDTNEDDLEKLVQVIKQSQTTDSNSLFKTTVLPWILGLTLPVLAIFYQMGEQRQELVGNIENLKLELRAEFIEKLSDNKDKTRDSMRDIENQVRDLIEAQNTLRRDMDRLEKVSDK